MHALQKVPEQLQAACGCGGGVGRVLWWRDGAKRVPNLPAVYGDQDIQKRGLVARCMVTPTGSQRRRPGVHVRASRNSVPLLSPSSLS